MSGVGTFRIDAEIENPARPGERRTLSGLLVDTGSEFSWVPTRDLEALGIARARLMRFRQATGQVVERWVGFAIVHVGAIATSDDVVFAELGDLLLLGSRTLDGLNVRVDPISKQLVDAGPAPAAAGGMISRGVLTSLGVLATLIAAPGAAQPTTRDSGGVRIVENTRPAWPNGGGWTLSATPVIDIGAGDDSLYQLATVMGAVRLSDGRIAVANMGTSNIRLYDARGRYLAALGRKGQGPGEFQQVMGVLRHTGDTLVVNDMRSEVEYFTAGGKFARRMPTPRLQDGIVLSEFHLFDDGSYARSSWPQGHDKSGRWTDTLVVLAVSKTAPDGMVISRHPAVEYTRPATSRGPQSVVFGPTGRIVSAGDGYYAGYPQRYEIRRHRKDGSLEAIIRAPWTPVAVSDADIDAYKNFIMKLGVEGGGQVPPRLLAQRKQMMDEAVFAKHLPAFSVLMVDTERHLWVRDSYIASYLRQGFSSTLPVPTSWRVFDREGRWLGAVTMPANFNPLDIGSDYVLGLWRDADDVEHVRLYRLVKTRTR